MQFNFSSVLALLVTGLLVACQEGTAVSATTDALMLESKIPLGDVAGRIDHLAVDLAHRRLFIAELGNNSVSVVDLADGKVLHRISGLKEPQGVGYLPSTDTLYVANAGDGAVHRFKGSDFGALGALKLGDDADNIRIDTAANQVIVGYGSGALAMLDATSGSKVGEIPLSEHPESFQLEGAVRAFSSMCPMRSTSRWWTT